MLFEHERAPLQAMAEHHAAGKLLEALVEHLLAAIVRQYRGIGGDTVEGRRQGALRHAGGRRLALKTAEPGREIAAATAGRVGGRSTAMRPIAIRTMWVRNRMLLLP